MRRPAILAAILVSLAVLTAASPASAMYHPTVGRWVSRDPVGYVDGRNLYEYAQSTPETTVDSHGLASDRGWGDDSARVDRSAKLLDRISKEDAAGGVSEDTVREAFAPNIYPDCPEGICPCPKTKAEAESGWMPDPQWVSPWLHPGSTSSYKQKGTYKRRGNQCTYDKAGNLITHGPAAGTPDLYGGRDLSNMLPHWNNDVKDLFNTLQTGPGANKRGAGSLPMDAAMGQFGLPAASPEVDAARTRNAVIGWKDIMSYQLSKGGFYRPCVPKDAPENWGDWKFDNGKLGYTGTLPPDPGPPPRPPVYIGPGTSGGLTPPLGF